MPADFIGPADQGPPPEVAPDLFFPPPTHHPHPPGGWVTMYLPVPQGLSFVFCKRLKRGWLI